MSGYILAIDQGTTSSRAIVFDSERKPIASDQKEMPQSFPKPGLVEHDAEEIWRTVVETARNAIAKAEVSASDIVGIGIANQRETVVIWDKKTGVPIHPAIVWQDRRTAEVCRNLAADGAGDIVADRTGLILDPYFSATKIAWILDTVPEARRRAEDGRLIFGTIDCFLLWKLTGGRVHATDATNASRTALYDIAAGRWDPELLSLFRVPTAMLPEVKDSSGRFGETTADILGKPTPILGMAGDQQAAMIGQGCFKPGMIKSTYGTGCFVVLNTGERIVRSNSRMLSTIAYRLDGKTTYALEGSIFVAGAAVQWLRDSLGLIKHASETGHLARDAGGDEGVILVPAFAGMGAPYWNPNARAAIFGLTRGAGVRELARATLESVCFQTRDLLEAMADDYNFDLSANGLRVDGGMTSSDWTMQALADCLGCQVQRSASAETTALGAAWLAGRQAGIWPDADDFSRGYRTNGHFESGLAEDQRSHRYDRWKAAVAATLAFAADS